MMLRDRLQAALTYAMSAKDACAMSALRSALSAIANAEALPVTIVPAAGAIEAAVGLGAAEQERLQLSEDEQREIVVHEINERQQAMADYEAAGRSDATEKLRAEIAVLRAVLDLDADSAATAAPVTPERESLN